MRREAAAIALLGVCGCSDAPSLLIIPDDVRARFDFVAAAGIDARGDVVALSGIDAVDGHVELTVDDPGAIAAVDLFAWEAVALPGMSTVDRAEARVTPLTVAQRCNAALAAPQAIVRVYGDGDALDVAPALTSAAVPGAACLPGWSRALSVEPRCVALLCQTDIVERGCDADVTLSGCGLDSYRVSARVGAPCAARLGDACDARELPSGGTELTCLGAVDCALRFYTRRDTGWASVRRTAVLEVTPQQPDDLETFGIRSLHRLSGYLGPIVALGDRVGVLSHRGRFYARSYCNSDLPSELHWYDLDAQLVATATVPACVHGLQPLASGRGAIGGWLEGAEVWVGEFARDGGLTRRRRVDLDPVVVPAALTESVLLADGSVVMSLTVDKLAPNNALGKLLVVDAETLAVRVLDAPDTTVMSLTLDRRDVVIAGDDQDLVAWIDPSSGAVVTTAELPSSGSKSVGDLEIDSATDRVFLATPGAEPSVRVYYRRQIGERMTVLDDLWLPTTLVRVGQGPGELLIASTLLDRSDGSYSAGLSRVNVEEDGVSPGVVAVGFGLLGEHTRDARGTLWATLPWSAEIVRVELTPD